ncbi:MAG: cyclase family protein [Armatimonadota bacterium]|nr:cyclase family protein [Armatimonadota bacterium]MDR7486967.1 cyclase family protein [Armatimonadota bacterium]MDR7532994.1 cyclase family protein [Armatimonadota bacterium]MDR7537596.1 cyclase family protein [Armatimonadota bacterium]
MHVLIQQVLRSPRALAMLGLVVLVAMSATAVAAERRARGGDVLAPLLRAVADGRIEVVELGATLKETTPVIQLPPPFANTPGFKKHVISAFDEKGPAWKWYWYEIGEHVGTHFDAPCHWVTGKDKPCLHRLDPRTLIGPIAVVDITKEAAANPDLVVTREMLLAWEQRWGRIPRGAWVFLRSGWSKKYAAPKEYFNVRDDGPHTPGMGASGARFLVQERDIVGVGVETIGTDAGQAFREQPPFPNHAIMHGAGKYGLTSLFNLDRLPITGAVLVVLPMKVEDGTGSPVRPIALVPRR